MDDFGLMGYMVLSIIIKTLIKGISSGRMVFITTEELQTLKRLVESIPRHNEAALATHGDTSPDKNTLFWLFG